MKLTPKQVVMLAVVVSVPVSAYGLVFRPQNREIARARAEIEMKEQMLAKLREATARYADLEKRNDEIKRSIESIEARLPTGKEIDNVLREVAQIAARNGLKVPLFKKSEKTVPAGEALEQPLEVEITGDFDGFYRFLLQLERIPRITRLPDLKIVRMGETDGVMKASFTLSIYYQGEKTSAAESAIRQGATP
ncbi:MAG: type 4a pilus biogenesis protein PilO [Phycisphaerales bacterium]|nr:type 4a pilus biogenesis protein PilO [Phycisphaerales bacterium]